MSRTTTVEWPSFCDLCEEYATTPERCSHCGHHLRPVERSEVPPPAEAALERTRVDDGLRLDRASVNEIVWGAVRNEATFLHTSLPAFEPDFDRAHRELEWRKRWDDWDDEQLDAAFDDEL